MRRVDLWVLIAILGTGQVVGQAGSVSASIGAVTGMGIGSSILSGQGIKGAPYSLIEITTTVKTLADGTTITNVQQWKQVRDSEGRQRTEMAKLKDGNTK